jgi:hypothetical protein
LPNATGMSALCHKQTFVEVQERLIPHDDGS